MDDKELDGPEYNSDYDFDDTSTPEIDFEEGGIKNDKRRGNMGVEARFNYAMWKDLESA